MPHFELPRPTLLDVYIAKQYLRILAMTTVGMLGLFYISTFIDMSDKLFKGQTTLGMIVEFLFWSTPEFLSYIIALAVLLSALVTVGLLTKNSELIVMRACGISLYRTALPMVAFALVASVMLFGMEERVLATANQRADRLKHLIRTGSAADLRRAQSQVDRRQQRRGLSLPVLRPAQPRAEQPVGLRVRSADPRAQVAHVRAASATYDPDRAPQGEVPKWALDRRLEARVRSEDAGQHASSAFDHIGARFETADYFVTEAREPELMNFGQLRSYITELKASGYNVLDHEVGLHRKIAFPFVTLVMTLIAVPFAVTTGRRGAMYGIGVGIVLALVYWTMISIFAAFGQGGLDRSDAGGVGAEPDLRRRGRLPAADGPHMKTGQARSADRRRVTSRGMVCLIARDGHAPGRVRPDDSRARARRLRHVEQHARACRG